MLSFKETIHQKWAHRQYDDMHQLLKMAIAAELTSLTKIRDIIQLCQEYKIDDLLKDAYEKLVQYDFTTANVYAYCTLIRDTPEEVTRLRRLTQLDSFFDCDDCIHMICARLLVVANDATSYTLGLNVVERWEKQLIVRTPIHFVSMQLALIAYEYQQKQWMVARNRLRHVLSAPVNVTASSEKLAYWAIVLDVLDAFIAHTELKQMLSNCPYDYVTIINSYRYLQQGKLNRKLREQVAQLVFYDNALTVKIRCYHLLLRYVSGENIALSELQQMKPKYKQDVYFQLVLVNVASPVYDHLWPSILQQHGDLVLVLNAYAAQHPTAASSKKLGVKVEVLGGGEKIGGTSIVLQYNGQKLMLDAGMYLDHDDFLVDFQPLENSGGLQQLDAVIVSHAHLDHTGSLPYIKKVAKDVPMYMTAETKTIFGSLVRSVVRNSSMSYYNEYDILCTEEAAIVKLFEQTFTVHGKNGVPWHITLYEAGHVIGAAAIHIVIDGISILFTGDYSLTEQRHCGKLCLPPNMHVDLLISESTYSYRPKFETLTRVHREQLLIASIERAINGEGSILIPTFAFGRAQEVLEIIQEHYGHVDALPFHLILDGNVVQMTEVYSSLRQPMSVVERAVIAQHFYDSEASFAQFYDLYVKDGGACIIASSGMLHKKSASFLYAQKMLSDPKHTIAFTGYLDAKSPAATVYEQRYNKGQAIFFGDAPCVIEATIEMHHFSAHVYQRDLLSLIMSIDPKHVILMHGEHEQLYNPYGAEIAAVKRLYMPIQDALHKLKVHHTLAKNGQKYTVER